MSKRIMSKWLVVLGLSAIYTVNTFAAAVSDVPASHWAYKSIVDIEKRGFMSLNSAGNFFPSATMNYFEVADVMAKATGYVDVEVNKNVDETFKNQIITNYNKQKPTLDAYAKKYSAWDKLYDQQVAYLLGRGYISTSDLDKFVNASGKATMTKQDLAVFIVRVLGKETTAKNTYKSTGYTDESSIKEANRPHVAYLKSLGLISGTGAFGAETKVTRALCAKMFNDAVTYKEKQQASTNGTTNNNTTANNASEQVTIKKVLTKNSNEYYVSLVRGSNTSYYTIKNTVQVLDANGKAVNILEVPAETKAKVTIALENSTEYITSMHLVGNTTVNDTIVNDTTTNNGLTNNTVDNTIGDTTTSTLQTVSGTLLEPSTNGIMRVALTDGTIKVYILDANNITLLNGVTVSADDLAVGSNVTLTLQGTSILKVQATASSQTGTNTNVVADSGEVTAKAFTTKGYIFTVKDGTNEVDMTVPTSAKLVRNNKNCDVSNIRIGDTLTFTKENGVITEVKATGTKKNIDGTLNAMVISASPTITIKTKTGLETYAVGNDAEFYDQKTRKYITLRELHLGQDVGIILDSKEVISLDVESSSSSANYKATISEVGSGYSYIDVIVDYDPISGDSQVPKRIYIPVNLSITLNGKAQSRSALEADMQVVITYQYLDDATPQKILILG